MRNTLTQEEIDLARFCIDEATSAGVQDTRVTLSKSCMDLIGTLNGQTDKVTHCLDRSISLALFVDGRFATYSTNRLDEESLKSFIIKSVETTRMLAPDKCRRMPDPERTEKGAVNGDELQLADDAYDTVTPESRLKTALDASIYASASLPEGISFISEECEYSDSIADMLIIDSQGTYCRHIETSFEFAAEVTVSDSEGNKFNSYWWDSSPRAGEISPRQCSEKALERAVAQIGPRKHRGGSYNMVVDRECASRLVTPLLNALSGYSIQQKSSFLYGKAGKKLFSPGLTISDVCRRPGQGGCRLFDSEGVSTKEWDIISNGRINNYFINTYIAAKTHRKPTVEDAFRPQIHCWPAPMDCDGILKMCGSGILVTGFNGGNSNSVTGDYSFGVEGYAFKNGRITHPVREMLITGNLIDLWNNLLAAGDDYRPCMSKLIPTLAFSNVEFR